MAKRKLIDNQLIEKEDLDGIQDYREEVDSYIINDLLEYDSVFTDTNFQAVEQTVPDMTVKITAGVGMINSNYSELVADGSVTIDAAGAVARTDLISVTSALTDDTAEAKVFINPSTEIAYTNTVAMKERYVPTLIYHKNTSVVPGGEVGICTILVSPGDTTVVNAMITDIRPEKPTSDVNSHRLATPIDHPAGSIGNVAISATADIGTEKINGISVGDLESLIGMGFPLNSVQTITVDGDGNVTNISNTGDHSWSMDITYNVDDEVDEIYLEDALYESTTNIVWVAGSPSTITTVVATK